MSSTTTNVFKPVAGRLPKVCGQVLSRITRDELPCWQPDAYGSKAWYDSFNRRNRIEGIFGNLKNDATQTVIRGNFRVMGLGKTAFMTMVAVMAVNLRPPNSTGAITPGSVRLTAARARPMPAHRSARTGETPLPGLVSGSFGHDDKAAPTGEVRAASCSFFRG